MNDIVKKRKQELNRDILYHQMKLNEAKVLLKILDEVKEQT